MKLIGILNGASAFREIAEEYQPKSPPPIQDLISAVQAIYQFIQYPVFHPGVPIPTTFSFSAGRFVHGDDVFAIGQLIMMQSGDVVISGNTHQSDLILEHLMEFMDTNFGYRLRESRMKRSYLSSIVVEFDSALELCIAKLTKVEGIINSSRNRNRSEFKVKRLHFGDSPDTTPPTSDPIFTIENADFVIERRTGSEFTENRYFCSAPMNTTAHIEALEAIDVALRE